jgi:hypothetical protein
MRLPFIILIGLVLGLLVFMKNPLREFQESRRELLMKYGTDELAIRTNLFVEQQQKSPMSFGSEPASGGKPGDMYKNMLQSQTDAEKNDDIKINPRTGKIETNSYKSSPSVASQTVAPPDRPLYEGDSGMGLNSPSYPGQRPGLNRQANFNQQYPAAPDLQIHDNANKPRPQKISNYYPPVMPDAAPSVKISSAGQKVALSGNEAKLRSGQPIIFDGMDVFTVDATGNKKVLPDGNYTLENGSGIRVSEGKLRGQD